jgi:hypothetical protein
MTFGIYSNPKPPNLHISGGVLYMGREVTILESDRPISGQTVFLVPRDCASGDIRVNWIAALFFNNYFSGGPPFQARLIWGAYEVDLAIILIWFCILMTVLEQLIPDRFAVVAASCNHGTSGGLSCLLDSLEFWQDFGSCGCTHSRAPSGRPGMSRLSTQQHTPSPWSVGPIHDNHHHHHHPTNQHSAATATTPWTSILLPLPLPYAHLHVQNHGYSRK